MSANANVSVSSKSIKSARRRRRVLHTCVVVTACCFGLRAAAAFLALHYTAIAIAHTHDDNKHARAGIVHINARINLLNALNRIIHAFMHALCTRSVASSSSCVKPVIDRELAALDDAQRLAHVFKSDVCLAICARSSVQSSESTFCESYFARTRRGRRIWNFRSIIITSHHTITQLLRVGN